MYKIPTLKKAEVIAALERTVGYNESENKEEYMKGALQAVMIMINMQSKLDAVTQGNINDTEFQLAEVKTDMESLVGIIQKYTPE